MNEVLVVDNLEFEVRRSPRRKTLGLTVDRAGELVVHSPATASETELHDWVEQKAPVGPSEAASQGGIQPRQQARDGKR